jgi:hypothetical protein
MFAWVLRVVVALGFGLAIYLLGAMMLRKFWVAPPAEPDPEDVHPLHRQYRCTVCGAEVTMTAAQGDDPEAPRHCREDMVLVDD